LKVQGWQKILYAKEMGWAGSMAHAVECLLRKSEALSSNATKKKKKKDLISKVLLDKTD
jgi:hypothetical protein